MAGCLGGRFGCEVGEVGGFASDCVGPKRYSNAVQRLDDSIATFFFERPPSPVNYVEPPKAGGGADRGGGSSLHDDTTYLFRTRCLTRI